MSPAWSRAIRDFLTYERASGKPETTNSARRHQLQHLAKRVNAGPWDLTHEQLREYFAAQKWAPETRRARRSTMCRFYGWALDEGHVTENLGEKIQKVAAPAGKPRPAPRRAYNQARLKAKPREDLMLQLAGELGLRRGEIAKVHTDDILDDGAGIALLVHGKGRRERILPVPSDLTRRLLDAPDGYLFPGDEDGHLSARFVGKLIADLLPDRYTAHTLRHMFATALYAATKDILLVQAMLGHASVATTQRYVEYDRSTMRDAVQRLADAA